MFKAHTYLLETKDYAEIRKMHRHAAFILRTLTPKNILLI